MPSEPLYTVQITFNSAHNLPVADLNTLSCDPYVLATLVVPGAPARRADEPPLVWRTPTLRRTRDPTWDCAWVVSGVPQSGFLLVMRLRDEDTDRDDRMGKAVADFHRSGALSEGFAVKEQAYKIQKRKGSFRPWIQTYVTAIIPGQMLRKHNRVIISVEVLGKAPDQTDRRVYTVGPNRFSQHFSPLIGSWVNRNSKPGPADTSSLRSNGQNKNVSASTFVANKLQLTGPVPKELHYHFVGYRSFMNGLFNNTGIRGHILNHGLRKQYRTVYSYDKSTLYGVIDDTHVRGAAHGLPEGEAGSSSMPNGSAEPRVEVSAPSAEAALATQFLEMTSWGRGARLFTYILTLDGEWRFTETGDEFSIDLLSKHSMHADTAKVVAFSGEFFVHPIAPSASDAQPAERAEAQGDGKDGQGAEERDPKAYELVIDNSSGTYRPKKEALPIFQEWLSDARRLGGLGRVTTMDSFDERLKKLKAELKQRKKAAAAGGEQPKRAAIARSGSSVSSVSGHAIGHTDSMSSSEVEAVLANAQQENEKKAEGGQTDTQQLNGKRAEEGGQTDAQKENEKRAEGGQMDAQNENENKDEGGQGEPDGAKNGKAQASDADHGDSEKQPSNPASDG